MYGADMQNRIDKPWGYEEIWAETDHYVGKIISIKKGHRISLQYHKVKEETIRILAGEMEFEFGHKGEAMKVMVLKEGNVHHIAPGMRHRMKAMIDCTVLEVSTPHLFDVVRLEDDYGRVNNGDPSLRSG